MSEMASRGRGRRVAAVAALAVLAAGVGAGAAASAGAFRSRGSSGSGPGGPPSATAAVVRRDLSSRTAVNATLGYAASYAVLGQGGGTLTWLPSRAGDPAGTGAVQGG